MLERCLSDIQVEIKSEQLDIVLWGIEVEI